MVGRTGLLQASCLPPFGPCFARSKMFQTFLSNKRLLTQHSTKVDSDYCAFEWLWSKSMVGRAGFEPATN